MLEDISSFTQGKRGHIFRRSYYKIVNFEDIPSIC
jgi:hypothetical protein